MGDLRVTSTVIGPAIRGATKSSNQKKLTGVNYSMGPRAVNPAHVGSTRLEDHRELGKCVGVDTIHPHAFRQACGVELLERSGGNLRAVQEHLRHADSQTTTI